MAHGLTPKQQMVIELLQNGELLITNSANPPYEKAYAGVTYRGPTIQISLRVFWNLVEKDLIYQQQTPPFNYILTEKGKSLKFKS